MLLPRIAQVMLSGFRNHVSLTLRPARSVVVLIGDNGVGKTNILEALSLFAPGRGLRRAEFADMVHRPPGGAAQSEAPSCSGFSVSVTLDSEFGEKRLGTGLVSSLEAPKGYQRQHRIDGVPVPSAAAFTEYMRVLWLTPDMDGLFRGSAGERRRFLDRLVLAVDSAHGARVSALERALRSRNRILEETPGRVAWLDAVEREIVELGIAVALARKEAVERLSGLIAATRDDASPFPFAVLELKGDVDALVAGKPAVEAEDAYRVLLRDNRAQDKAAARTLIGPQTSDLVVIHGPKAVAAGRASTGEQKALLIGLILAQARLIKQMSGIAPLVLLDEIAAHLDTIRRKALFDTLEGFSGQVWVTGADESVFSGLAERADLFHIPPRG
ncbi:MAG: DNA replication/repair protein RecF [Methylobacteriaceae bacterium]|jgi:DNA replication and repair protein RecF|nr:DNA replication/repair protein RecF [Methylobacteriaceae bacterium]